MCEESTQDRPAAVVALSGGGLALTIATFLFFATLGPEYPPAVIIYACWLAWASGILASLIGAIIAWGHVRRLSNRVFAFANIGLLLQAGPFFVDFLLGVVSLYLKKDL
jgi:hypothetical protein